MRSQFILIEDASAPFAVLAAKVWSVKTAKDGSTVIEMSNDERLKTNVPALKIAKELNEILSLGKD